MGVEICTKGYRIVDHETGSIQVTRDVNFEIGMGKAMKFKETSNKIFTFDILHLNENTPRDNKQNVEKSNEDNANWDKYVPKGPHNITSDLISSHESATSSTSSTSEAPPKLPTLADIYEDCSELLFLQDDNEPTSYSTEKGIVE